LKAAWLTDLPILELSSLSLPLLRIVESQEDVAELALADSAEDAYLLQEMIEASKPGLLPDHVDYLLATPFRYPPLRYGSRFGSVHERGMFYGSFQLDTCLCECAYYRFKFLFDMASQLPNPLKTSHTVFRVDLKTTFALDTRAAVFDQALIRSKNSYEYTHEVGTRAREMGAHAIIYKSARCDGDNAAVIELEAIDSTPPRDKTAMQSVTAPHVVSFIGAGQLKSFPISLFLDQDREFPNIAS
jgi:hypothetical protein